MLEAPSPSLGYLLAAELEAVQASCWVLAFIHRYCPVSVQGAGEASPVEGRASFSAKAGEGETKTASLIDCCCVSWEIYEVRLLLLPRLGALRSHYACPDASRLPPPREV